MPGNIPGETVQEISQNREAPGRLGGKRLTSSQGANSLQENKSRLVIENLRLGILGLLAAIIEYTFDESERAGDASYLALVMGTAHWPRTVQPLRRSVENA